jgi:serine/threonine protein kinase
MGDLYEAIRLARGPLETQHVRAFMLQLVDAVEFIHAKGLYHRDIKPENIFLSQDGSMKLGDFGLATSEAWTYEASVGSDRYMAPEQYDPADTGYSPAQADIWSVGICLLNILFCRNPFVIPSESDVLFADFVRDRQSLFDIFPSMSQDTFEVLTHALSIDPSKRSLAALRAGLERVISFTTDDDLFDDFCTNEGSVVTSSANRMPFRTPSIQSPPIEAGGAFPWAKALQMNTPQMQALAPIADSELEPADVFPEKGITAWCTAVPETPSMASVIDSTLGQSIQSMNLKEPQPRNTKLSESVPIKGRAMSMVFGKDTFSKSWSDLWDEELEEEEEDARKRYNDRNWSTDTLDVGPASTGEADRTVFDGSSDESLPASTGALPVYSPPAKRSVLDKWAALGNRRRAVDPPVPESKPETPRKRAYTGHSWRRGFGFGSISTFSSNKQQGHTKGTSASAHANVPVKGFVTGYGPTERRESRSRDRRSRDRDSGIALWELNDWRKDAGPLTKQDRRYSAAFDDGLDAEWVGGWRDLHL